MNKVMSWAAAEAYAGLREAPRTTRYTATCGALATTVWVWASSTLYMLVVVVAMEERPRSVTLVACVLYLQQYSTGALAHLHRTSTLQNTGLQAHDPFGRASGPTATVVRSLLLAGSAATGPVNNRRGCPRHRRALHLRSSGSGHVRQVSRRHWTALVRSWASHRVAMRRVDPVRQDGLVCDVVGVDAWTTHNSEKPAPHRDH